jgi:hypothetical protein
MRIIITTREIALMMRRSRGAVRDALHKTNTDEPRRPGPPPVLSERDVRRLVRLAAQGNHTAGQLKRELELVCSARTVVLIFSFPYSTPSY